ncbi:cytochrome c oxidase subunit 3 [Aeromonas caviae]|uniref:cytochrome c oxidase subunit 3 n=1 Tax=Aeromonas caviae TaxID=648 RepID=UPI00225135BA|nr:cytochrome c oxidase subunit 3 [Aeromonas caviae]MCX4035690.1 cytochrome c oxidase subunit 3 [Aeromonas caviae]
MAKVNQTYYVPDQSRWPIIGAIALFFLALGAGHLVNEVASGQTGFGRYLMMAGVALLAFMLFGWFRHIIRESMTGLYSAQMDRSFRQGMVCSPSSWRIWPLNSSSPKKALESSISREPT